MKRSNRISHKRGYKTRKMDRIRERNEPNRNRDSAARRREFDEHWYAFVLGEEN